ncbi:MAG: DMT family transporter [Acidobacteria bacterium]|nr:DMT family transporter [Acidobacteriota bacterium]
MSLPLRVKADLALVGIIGIWGASFVVVKAALADASPLAFLLLRFLVAAAALLAISWRSLAPTDRGTLRAGAVIGFFLFAGFAFQTIGLQHTTPTKSAFITALSVPLVPLLLVVLFRRRPRWEVLAGIAAATLGMYLLTVPAGIFQIARGDLFTLGCALAFAGHIVAIGRYAPRFGHTHLALWQILVALALLILVAPAAGLTGLDAFEVRWSGRLLLALGVTGVLATALAFSVQTWAQQFTLPTHTAIIFSLEPVFAALTSYLVLRETLGWRGLAGAGLILFGVLLVELRGAPVPIDAVDAPAG